MLLLQLLVNGIVISCGYALIAIGFGLIYGTTRVFHFAHGAVYTASAYAFYSLSDGLGYWGAAAVTTLGAAAAGVLIDEIIYRGLTRHGGSQLALLLSSLALYTITVNVIALGYGSGTILLNRGADVLIGRFPVFVTLFQALTVACFLAVFTLLGLMLMKTSLGKLIRAMRDNPELVSAVGFNPRRVRWAVFSLGSGFAAVAAVLMSLDMGITPHVGMGALLNAAVAVILGGIGRFRGAALGAFVLGVLQSVAIWWFSARWVEAVAFVALVGFLLYRTEGISVRARRVEELAA